MGTLCTWCLPQLGLVSDSWLKLLLIFYEAQQCALRIIMYFELNQSLDLSQFHTISMFLSLPGRKRWAKKFATGWYNHPGHLCFAVTAFVLWAMSCYGFLRPNLLTLEPKTSEQILTVQKRCAAFLWVHWKKHEKQRELSHESSGSFHMLFRLQRVDLFWGSPDLRQFGGAEWPKWIWHVEWSQRPVLHFLRTKAWYKLSCPVIYTQIERTSRIRLNTPSNLIGHFKKGFLDLSALWNLAHQHPVFSLSCISHFRPMG